MSEKGTSRLIQAGSLVLFVLAWHAATATGRISPIFLPPPADVLVHLFRIVATGEVLPDLGVTLYELTLGYGIAVTLGVSIGYLVSKTRYSTRVFEPLFAAIFAIPIIVFYPMNILFFGLGPESKIVHGALFGFFPIVLNTISGFAHVDASYLRLARAMGASDGQLFRRILLPAALPIVLTGLRIGFILCFLAVIGGETIASLEGLGHRIVWYAESMEIVKMYAYIVIVIAIAVALNALVSLVETRQRG